VSLLSGLSNEHIIILGIIRKAAEESQNLYEQVNEIVYSLQSPDTPMGEVLRTLHTLPRRSSLRVV